MNRDIKEIVDMSGESNKKSPADELILDAWDELNLGNTDEAVAKGEAALELDPDDWYVNSSLGLFFRERQEMEKSLHFCQRGVELAPEMSLAWTTLATTQLERERFKEAAEGYAKAVELKERPSTYTLMASAKINMDDFEGAIEAAKRALELDPEWDEAEALLKQAETLLAEQ